MRNFVIVLTVIAMIVPVVVIAIFSNLKELLESNRSDFGSTFEFVMFVIFSPFVFPYAVFKTSQKAISAGLAKFS